MLTLESPVTMGPRSLGVGHPSDSLRSNARRFAGRQWPSRGLSNTCSTSRQLDASVCYDVANQFLSTLSKIMMAIASVDRDGLLASSLASKSKDRTPHIDNALPYLQRTDIVAEHFCLWARSVLIDRRALRPDRSSPFYSASPPPLKTPLYNSTTSPRSCV